jgi:hypothetical protein
MTPAAQAQALKSSYDCLEVWPDHNMAGISPGRRADSAFCQNQMPKCAGSTPAQALHMVSCADGRQD